MREVEDVRRAGLHQPVPADTGPPDARTADAGLPDARTAVDAGPPDAGSADAGSGLSAHPRVGGSPPPSGDIGAALAARSGLAGSKPPPEDIGAALAARRDLGWVRLVYLPEVGSTNDVAVRLAGAGAPDGTTVLAARQTGGRGRRGRAWHSPRDAGLYLTTLVRGAPSPLLTLLAGVAVAEAIRAVSGVAAELKWPNDVVLRVARAGGSGAAPRKVAGILSERLPAAAGEGAVVGIGVNVRRADYPPDLADRAAPLETAAGRAVERGPLLAGLLAGLRHWSHVAASGGAGRLLDRWRRLSPSSVGSPVSWDGPGAGRHGLTAGIGDDGALLVDCRGRTERIVGGEVRWT